MAADLKIASLDIGSNSFLLLLCQANANGITKVYHDEIEIVRLGQGLVANKKFLPEALVRATETLKKFEKQIEKFKPDKIIAKATAAARTSENSGELIKIGRELNIPIEIIAGNKEAQITYQGVFWGQNQISNDYNLLIDIGGGSTELIVGRGLNIEFCVSLPFGAVTLTETFIKNHPVSVQDQTDLMTTIDLQITTAIKSISHFPVENIFAVAGTPTTLAQIVLGDYDDLKINGYELSAVTMDTLIVKLKNRSVAQRIDEMAVPKGRADIIYAGAVLLRQLMKAVNREKITVSTRGVRHGIVADYFLSQ